VRYFDISPELSSKIAVFPGDQAFKQHVAMHVDRGDHISLSSIHTTVHVGAHVDAPIHYAKNGQSIAERKLDIFVGKAQVISVKKALRERITVADVSQISIKAPRVLFNTQSFLDPNTWHEGFVACSAELIDFLASKGVKLVGIDTPSVDISDSKDLESHKAVAAHDMSILEGIILSEVPDGIYTLIALPLKIKDADASPVRAILIDRDLGLE
jgi:arylformamidase